ncbi:MAG: HNH endonuclease [Candidatus Xenobiia bacterium LiM19]
MYQRDFGPTFQDTDDEASENPLLVNCRQVAVQLREGEPICDVDELVQKIATRSINRYDAAFEADEELDLIMLKRRGIDFRLGELLTLFKKKKGEDYMGHRSIGTFSVEHLSFSGRLASELMRNSGLLSTLPLTKEAYLQGEIKKSALRHLSRVLTAENEADWIAKTKKLSLKALERMVKKALQKKETAEKGSGECGNSSDANGFNGGEHNESTGADRSSGRRDGSSCADGSGGGERDSLAGADDSDAVEPHDNDIPSEESTEPQKGLMMYLDVSIRLAPVWDFALEQFRNGEQVNGSTSTFVEALLANYITSGKKAGNRSSAPAEDSELPVFYRCHMKKPERDEELFDDDDRQIPAGKSLPGSQEDEGCVTKQIIFPPSFHETPETVEDLTDKLIELGRYRQVLDVGMAKILWAIEYWDLYSALGYSQIEEYGKKKCDLPNSMLYRLMRMADGFRRRPLIEKAFNAGLISKENARQILRISDEDNERIWIDFAAHSPSVTLKEELERCLRIIDYDCFSRSFYNIIPGFRYITDERYGELTDNIKKAIRTGSWYRGSSPDEAWPLVKDDEHELMERDPRLEEPWRYFEDVDDFLVYEVEVSERKSKRSLCATLGCQDGESRKSLCATLGCQDGESRKSLCATLGCQDGESRKSLCATLGCQDGESRKSLCATLDNQADCNEATLLKAREICTIPHGADPAETFVLDILADQIGTLPKHSTMPIRFFLPEELFGMWNTCFGLYLLQPGADDSAQGFIAALLQEWLIIEQLHFNVTRNYAILKRDRFRCQAPGCNCRRNLHIHHIIPRSHGGSDDPHNLIVLCEKCHLRLLHDLHTLQIEGTAPFNLTFTFGSASMRGDGRYFLKYVRGRKVLQPQEIKPGRNRSGGEKMTILPNC